MFGMQVMNVHETTLAAPEFQVVTKACMDHVELSYNATQEYVVSTFEASPCTFSLSKICLGKSSIP